MWSWLLLCSLAINMFTIIIAIMVINNSVHYDHCFHGYQYVHHVAGHYYHYPRGITTFLCDPEMRASILIHRPSGDQPWLGVIPTPLKRWKSVEVKQFPTKWKKNISSNVPKHQLDLHMDDFAMNTSMFFWDVQPHLMTKEIGLRPGTALSPQLQCTNACKSWKSLAGKLPRN